MMNILAITKARGCGQSIASLQAEAFTFD